MTLTWIVARHRPRRRAVGAGRRGADARRAVEGRPPPGEPVGRRAARRRRCSTCCPRRSSARPPPQALFATLLGGLLFFFLLEKAELYRHSHHHEGDEHHHHHGFDRQQAGRGGWSVILGDSIHNFCDGIIIAAAFLADTRLGVVTSLAIIAHEIPQEVGDYIVLLNAGFSRGARAFFNALSGLAAVAGGIVGYFIVGPWQSYFPYLLVVAASSFIYVAVADLIPQLQHRLTLKETAAQLFWLGAGLASSSWR